MILKYFPSPIDVVGKKNDFDLISEKFVIRKFMNFWNPPREKKIMRLTIGAQGCNFLTSFEQFRMIFKYF